MKRHATARWTGSGKEGSGQLTTQSGVFDAQPYSFKTRFENEDGQAGTNPEELIAAAHAGCFAMALSFQLNEAGYTADSLETTAKVDIKPVEGGFKITTIHLDLTGDVPGIGAAEFQKLAQQAKEGCPVSQALAAVDISLEAKLK